MITFDVFIENITLTITRGRRNLHQTSRKNDNAFIGQSHDRN